ncbi:MAG: Glycosyl transferase family 2 [Clostridium sp.]|jgi:glycosyltransferase involved in cell wall biosynthesis
MSRYKICVYAICKNEEQFVDRWMDSMSEADLVVVTDTGSTDTTVEKLKARGAIVYTEEISPWRFDKARNCSLDHVPQDVDICVCTDLDEVFEKGWRGCIESAWQPDTTMGKYLYNWSLHPDGTPAVQFHYFKCHARHGYRWVYPVHECLSYIGNKPQKEVFIPGMVLNHYPDPNKSRSSYLPLLEMAVKENPNDDRMMYYLGREYMYRGQWQDCINTLKRHLSLPTATWREERCASMRWIALSYFRLFQMNEAYRWYYRAVAEAPWMRDPYVEFAQMCYQLGDWPAVFSLTEQALKIHQRSPVYVNAACAWDHTPDDLCAIACYQLGMYERSYEHAKAALSYTPNSARLKRNLELIAKKVRTSSANLT